MHKLINADVNGSLHILRTSTTYKYDTPTGNKLFNPVVLNPYQAYVKQPRVYYYQKYYKKRVGRNRDNTSPRY